MPADQKYGDLLKARRISLDLTQQTVADRAGIKLRQYQRFEHDERSIRSASFDVACRVLKALDMSISVIFSEQVKARTIDKPDNSHKKYLGWYFEFQCTDEMKREIVHWAADHGESYVDGYYDFMMKLYGLVVDYIPGGTAPEYDVRKSALESGMSHVIFCPVSAGETIEDIRGRFDDLWEDEPVFEWSASYMFSFADDGCVRKDIDDDKRIVWKKTEEI